MIAPITGRFDNAPAHIIINSPRFSAGDKERCSEKEDAKRDATQIVMAKKAADVAERKAARAIAWQTELVRRAEARAIVKASERKEKEALSARLAREAKARKAIEKKKDEVWLDTNPKRLKVKSAHAKARDAEQKRERYAAKVAALKASIPAGWVQSSKLGLDYSVSGLNVAMRTGRIKAVKIGRYWYCDPAQAGKYAETKYARRCEVLDNARAAAIKARWGK